MRNRKPNGSKRYKVNSKCTRCGSEHLNFKWIEFEKTNTFAHGIAKALRRVCQDCGKIQ